MRAEDSAKWCISVCGLNCAKCDIHKAGHGNEKLLGEMIEWFRKERNETVTRDQIRCDARARVISMSKTKILEPFHVDFLKILQQF